MEGTMQSVESKEAAVGQLRRRAAAIVGARPAYRELVDFYLTVFCRQIEWRERIEVAPEPLDLRWIIESLGDGAPLIERFDPGIRMQSVVGLWGEMKGVFRRGNATLSDAVDRIEAAERSGAFEPGRWLLDQRPDRGERVAQAAREAGVEESVFGTLGRAVTFPHWEAVAHSWLPQGSPARWQRARCPACGGPPVLAETRSEPSGHDGVGDSPRRYLHCPFCGTRWAVPGLARPSCGSTKPGDARYLFTKEEPELRIDYCTSCRCYIKTIDGDKLAGPMHAGLEQLTTTHLDIVAEDMDLKPLDVLDDRCSGGRFC